jgi:ATP-dependent exoDNAse (exonuclease V) alpha subunit
MLRFCMTDTAPDKQLLRSANEQIKAVRRERDELAQQIRLSQETIARSQALIARLDKLLRDLERHEN